MSMAFCLACAYGLLMSVKYMELKKQHTLLVKTLALTWVKSVKEEIDGAK